MIRKTVITVAAAAALTLAFAPDAFADPISDPPTPPGVQDPGTAVGSVLSGARSLLPGSASSGSASRASSSRASSSRASDSDDTSGDSSSDSSDDTSDGSTDGTSSSGNSSGYSSGYSSGSSSGTPAVQLPAVPKLPAVTTPQNALLPKLPNVPAVGVPALPNSDTVPDLVGSMTSNATASDNQTLTLSPNGGSGITATVKVKGLSVAGKAKGLDPSKRYISLYYGSMSTPKPGQTLTCADLRTAAFPQQWGLSPEWKVASDGTGTLNVTAPRKLSQGVYTMSIREVPSTGMSDPYVGFNPVTYPVRACGVTR